MRGLLFMAARYPLGQLILGILFVAFGLYCLITLLVAQMVNQPLTSDALTVVLIMGIGFTALGCFELLMSYLGFKKKRLTKAASEEAIRALPR
jgi:hypothetical protein